MTFLCTSVGQWSRSSIIFAKHISEAFQIKPLKMANAPRLLVCYNGAVMRSLILTGVQYCLPFAFSEVHLQSVSRLVWLNSFTRHKSSVWLLMAGIHQISLWPLKGFRRLSYRSWVQREGFIPKSKRERKELIPHLTSCFMINAAVHLLGEIRQAHHLCWQGLSVKNSPMKLQEVVVMDDTP